ncbi:MAG: cation diffusion facilitator family transporter, partial [Chitinophagia bacterium]|nr:cation diffusion facilitator family transporter [Chitinophagia bacterium]
MKRKIVIQRFVVLLSLILFATKIIAWRLTNSVTLFTDAMDSIVNVVAAVLGLASLYISSKPKDINHPLGHGKIEFLTSVAEGGMICGAGFIIIYESIQRIIVPSPIEKLDVGLIIIVIAGVLNYAIGLIACRYGEAKGSMVLISAGNHLKTDGYSAWGMVVGLLLLMFTGNRFYWLDSAVALVFAASDR